MADRFWSVDLGENIASAVTEGSSTSSEAIELRCTYTTTGVDKRTVLVALESIRNYILQDAWPPNT